MGMNEGEARAFYAMTNSAPYSRPRSLTTAELARWARLETPVFKRSTPLAVAATRAAAMF